MPDNAAASELRVPSSQEPAMAYTVKQVAEMSRVSVRTLHFYDENGLLKPAYLGANGYRFYEEPQLLALQQILFYRELGLELKQIKDILGRADFGIAAALESHRQILQNQLDRTRVLIETVDKTIQHLKGKTMQNEEMFAGFSVAAGEDRFGEEVLLGGEPVNCKLSGKDTGGALSIFETTVGWPRHLHHEQDEWIYVVSGELDLEIAGRHSRLKAGESTFIPRRVPHVWAPAAGKPARVINSYQPAGTMEEFFRAISNFKDVPTVEQVVNKTYTDEQVKSLHEIFDTYGMDLLGPGLLPQ
jgi:DNA-binding transcriptional MerR regulator